MSKKSKTKDKTSAITGECCICGTSGNLTREHFPPQKAFNNKRVRPLSAENNRDKGIIQGGINAYTICLPCNNNTGAWYGGAYTDFTRNVAAILERNSSLEQIDLTFEFSPLNVIKQVVSSFFSVNGHGLRIRYPELVNFILDKSIKNLPAGIRIFTFATSSDRSRIYALSARGIMGSSISSQSSEYVVKPLGFVMTFDTGLLDENLTEVTHFSEFALNEKVALSIKLPVKPVCSSFPCDYRSQEKMESDFLNGRTKDKSLNSIRPKKEEKGNNGAPSFTMKMNFSSVGPVSGAFSLPDDIIYSVEYRKSAEFLGKYKLVLFTACTSENINDEHFSVTHFSNNYVEGQPTSVAYRGLSGTNAVRYGLKHLIEKYLTHLPLDVIAHGIA